MQCNIYPTLCSHKTEHTAVQRAVSVYIAVLLPALVLTIPEMLRSKRRWSDDCDHIKTYWDFVLLK